MFIDGELERPKADQLREQLVFDQRLKKDVRDWTRLDRLVVEALGESDMAGVNERVGQIEKMLEPEVEIAAGTKTRRTIKPALVASVGVLVTAGIALAELRRRGVV